MSGRYDDARARKNTGSEYYESYHKSGNSNRKKRSKSQNVSFRKPRQNKLGIFLVTFAALLIVGVIFMSGLDLQKKIDVYNGRIAELTAEIAKEEQRAAKIEEYRKYTQTKGFVEEIAQDQLGLVYKGEIIFKQDQ